MRFVPVKTADQQAAGQHCNHWIFARF